MNITNYETDQDSESYLKLIPPSNKCPDSFEITNKCYDSVEITEMLSNSRTIQTQRGRKVDNNPSELSKNSPLEDLKKCYKPVHEEFI